MGFIIFLVWMISFAWISQIKLHADESNVTTVNGASYYVEETTDEKDLGYGVHYQRDISYTSANNSEVCKGNAAGSGGGGPVEFGKFYEQQVNVLELNPSQEVKIVPWALLDGPRWALATVRTMAIDYEATHPGWKVVAATNGDFFKQSEPYGSTGVTISSGEYLKTHVQAGHFTLGFRNDGSTEQLVEITDLSSKPTLTIYDDNGSILYHDFVQKVNEKPAQNETAVFYINRTGDFQSGFIPMDVNDVYLAHYAPTAVTVTPGYFYGKGKITDKVTQKRELTLGEFAVSSLDSTVASYLKVGAMIRVQYEFTSEQTQGIESFIGYPTKIMLDSVYQGNNADDFHYSRHPRTMIGQKEDGTIVMAVVDGRQPTIGRYGACTAEMSAIMTHYGCVDAWNLDGGGSSTLIIRKQDGWKLTNPYNDSELSDFYVTNSPSDGRERTDGNCLLIVAKVPEFDIQVSDVTSTSLVVHVDLLTDKDRWKEIYVALNGGEKIKVVDGKVSYNDLNVHESYQFKLYGYENGKYLDFMTYERFHTAFKFPTLLSTRFEMKNVNDVNSFVISCTFDKTNAIRKVMLIVGDQTYTSTSGIFVIEENPYFFVHIDQLKFKIRLDLDDYENEFEEDLSLVNPIYTNEYCFSEFRVRVHGLMSELFD